LERDPVASPINAISVVKVENRHTINDWLSLPDAYSPAIPHGCGHSIIKNGVEYRYERHLSLRSARLFCSLPIVVNARLVESRPKSIGVISSVIATPSAISASSTALTILKLRDH
jgi:hypothetical protein